MSDQPNPELLSFWPGRWPGQGVVDLDNLGDPGIWLDDRMPLIEGALCGTDIEISKTSAFLAEDYIAAAAEMSFPIPSDFEVNDDECREMIKTEFRAFLLEWRRRIETAPRK